ncbi:YwiC-like family protein [Brevibacillus humidisoli]|uniref:YwiC-like family protein n=1 Tax=Brevibacillus humidisoli TaxID=2895522 RepID=UPI001E5218A6|nr:YwiC-like family protein [Brevibacillus humidisoli]UFJ41757.1 YwiC-like family protein [Brevibacillus humidisoli]
MKKGYLPNQHGAWAMLIIPFLFGMIAAKPVWLHAPLFLVWLLVYLFSYPFLQWIRTGRTALYGTPMLLYGSLLIPSGVAVLVIHPALGWMVPLFVPLFLVNCYYARINQERSLINDLAAVVQFSLIIFVVQQAGGGSSGEVAAELFAISLMYFTGTVFYVKTIIREKHNKKYYFYSIGYHLAILVMTAIWFPLGLLIPFAVLLGRAIWTPRMRVTVKQVGILEILFSVLITCSVLYVYLT